jgi:hypothetical protein
MNIHKRKTAILQVQLFHCITSPIGLLNDYAPNRCFCCFLSLEATEFFHTVLVIIILYNTVFSPLYEATTQIYTLECECCSNNIEFYDFALNLIFVLLSVTIS